MSFQKALVGVASSEWEFFGKDEGTSDKFVEEAGDQKRKETVSPYQDRVADYWLSISETDYKRLMKAYKPASGRLDGRLNIPWSAAFISYCMQTAGAGLEFPYSSGHATWIVKAIRNRKANKLKAPLVGYKPGEIAVAAGDLLGNPRESGVTYDTAVAKGWFLSHTDIVVEVNEATKEVHTIGGNVGQSVGRKTFKVKSDGKLTSSGPMFHIQNNITGEIKTAGVALQTIKVG